MSTAKSETGQKSGTLNEILKSLVVSIAITMILILLFALMIKWFDLPDAAIVPVNQAIKAISLFSGTLMCFKTRQAGWRKGLITGILYIVFAFIIFSLLEGVFTFDRNLIIDILLGGVMGMICGIIAVNIRK